jgi:hypothetical protein
MIVRRATTIALEIAHFGENGVLHGHTMMLEAWTDRNTCLDAWQELIRQRTAHIEGQLEQTIGGRTFEDVAVAALKVLPEAVRVVVRLPSRGHVVEAIRDPA